MTDSWETVLEGVRHWVHATDREVAAGHAVGRDGSAGAVSHEAFLTGTWDGEIRATFGAIVLRDLTDVVRARRFGAGESGVHPPSEQRAFLDGIPSAPELEALARRRPDDFGELHFGNVAGSRFSTRLVSDSRTLTYDSGTNAELEADEAAYPTRLTLPGIAADGLADRDHFYLVRGASFVVLGPDGERIERATDHGVFGEELRIVGVRRYGRSLCYLYQWFRSGRAVDGCLVFDPATCAFTTRWEFGPGARLPERPRLPAPRAWSWKNTRSSPGASAGDLLGVEVHPHGRIDWHGEDLHSLSKGAFTIGRQSFDEFLVHGPPEGLRIPGRIVAEIGQHLLESGWSPSKRRAASARARDERRARRRAASRAAVSEAAARPLPRPLWEGRTSFLQIEIAAEGWPRQRIERLTLDLGKHVVFSGGVPSSDALASARSILVYQGRARRGRHRLFCSTDVRADGEEPCTMVVVDDALSLSAASLLTIRIDREGGFQCRSTPMGKGKLLCRARAERGPGQRLVDATAWLGDLLVWDSRLGLPKPRVGGESRVESLLEAPTLLLYEGPVNAGQYLLRLRTVVEVEGEVDPRIRMHEREITVLGSGTTTIEVGIPAEETSLRPEQVRKAARLGELSKEIAEAMRAGGCYRYGDPDGFWEEIRYEQGTFTHRKGCRSPEASVSVIRNEGELVARLEERHGQVYGDRVATLEAILAIISQGIVNALLFTKS